MSNFLCEKCNTLILDLPSKGQITFCAHYPPIKPKEEMPEFLKDIFGNDN